MESGLVARSPIQPDLVNVSRDGASTTALGNLFQCLTTLIAPFQYWKAAMRSPRSLLFSRLNSPNSLSLSSQDRCSSPQVIFMSLLWTCSNSSMSFLCRGLQSWMQ
ncbi:hypothetical protein QYF61_001625 [Mycteria americana]|uniref:Uncharacterized protein n=1 Tax=Mycteria americana TaxID=33587 RepID=A0AAN7RXE0_MYCAM|nr:hypothetical protein QYF61_001625 [Mycteria americana]